MKNYNFILLKQRGGSIGTNPEEIKKLLDNILTEHFQPKERNYLIEKMENLKNDTQLKEKINELIETETCNESKTILEILMEKIITPDKKYSVNNIKDLLPKIKKLYSLIGKSNVINCIFGFNEVYGIGIYTENPILDVSYSLFWGNIESDCMENCPG